MIKRMGRGRTTEQEVALPGVGLAKLLPALASFDSSGSLEFRFTALSSS
jgi:hypothetical protein